MFSGAYELRKVELFAQVVENGTENPDMFITYCLFSRTKLNANTVSLLTVCSSESLTKETKEDGSCSR